MKRFLFKSISFYPQLAARSGIEMTCAHDMTRSHMEKNGENTNLNIGILAHVDAGKTTLAEAILLKSGQIRKAGRVDHKDAFLDNYALERERGITIFSKQAEFEWNNRKITLLDTPGHVDFGAEMERTLQVMDVAVLVISGIDGVQGHTETLWNLLKRYGIPTFLFVNKMDREEADRDFLKRNIQKRLSHACVEFSFPDDGTIKLTVEAMEDIASCEEGLMEEFIETGNILEENIIDCISQRKIFPCFYGSALRQDGIGRFLDGLARFAPIFEYGEEFGARVFKITRDNERNRLTHMKITGGTLRAKQLIGNENSARNEKERWQEKTDQLRIYNGGKYILAEEVKAGDICAVTGLKNTFAGEGLGFEEENYAPLLEPVMVYSVLPEEGMDVLQMKNLLKGLEEEYPELHIVWNEKLQEINIQVMGKVQIEILKGILNERFGLDVSFGEGSIVYKETIASPVLGVGHYEPLRHYAEVQLLMEPGERGSGLEFASMLSEDVLDKNWQRLILTHLEEKSFPGVLTGLDITDMRIILAAGKAHEKHTEGGDFREATYRAVRQGLMKAENVLLEPVFSFRLEVPTESVGHAMSDIKMMHGVFEGQENNGETSILTGWAPVFTMRDYQTEVSAYTKGRGKLNLAFLGYEPCHNTEEVMQKRGYDPENDPENPAYSVFCSHGAGCAIEWRQVDAYAHTSVKLKPEDFGALSGQEGYGKSRENDIPVERIRLADEKKRKAQKESPENYITQEEIETIFERTYGKKKDEGRRRYYKAAQEKRNFGGAKKYEYKPVEKKEEYLLVDGYNIIFAWEELNALSKVNLDAARDKLIDIMGNYQGFTGVNLILVFDAYKVKNNPGTVLKYGNISVVYTREAQTADQYIEQTVHKMGHKHNVTVATSDGLEQMIIWGEGAKRLSAAGLKEAVALAEKSIRENYLQTGKSIKNLIHTE